MAPEQAAGGELTPATDVYALAATCYFAITGQPVFAAEAPERLLAAQINDPPVRMALRSAVEVPDDLDRIVMRALSKDPAHRHADAGALARALAECALAGQWRPRRAEPRRSAATAPMTDDATAPLARQEMP
jgi:serine/threonine-protein kinase